MIGVLVQLAISWLLLWLLERKDLRALGVVPDKSRVNNLVFGFIAAAVCNIAYNVTLTTLTENHWSRVSHFGITNFFSSFFWVLNSVLFEELIFRGALLYILIRKIGVVKACLISATAFGFYHWFSYGIIGDPKAMFFVYVMTAIWGFMFAWAFAKTQSLYLPVALHLGWNLFHIVVFSDGPLGIQMFINANDGTRLEGIPSLLMWLFQVVTLPVIVYVYLKRKRTVTSPE